MAGKRKTAQSVNKKDREIPLYRVFSAKTQRPVYLPVGKGLPKDEAQRLSDGLALETYIDKTYEPDTDE